MAGRKFDSWENIEQRLCNFPNIEKFFGKKAIKKLTENNSGHPLPWILSRDMPSDAMIKEWEREYSDAWKKEDLLKVAAIGMVVSGNASQYNYCIHLNKCLGLLDSNIRLNGLVKRMKRNDKEFWDAFNELEINAILSLHGDVEIEPNIRNGKKLDCKIKLDERAVYFEIMTIHLAKILSTGKVASFGKERLKKKIIDKAIKQIFNVPEGYPVILVLPLGYGETDIYDILNSVLGSAQITMYFDKKTGKCLHTEDTRDSDSMVNIEKKTKRIGAILHYKKDLNLKGNCVVKGGVVPIHYSDCKLTDKELLTLQQLFNQTF